jgi:plasmid maintenance system antidote protein VapI
MRKQRNSMTDLLKRAIAQSGQPFMAIERATGVQRASLLRFLRGETSLRLDKADDLAEYFGIESRLKRK